MTLPVSHKQNQAVTNQLQQPKHDLSVIEQVVMQGDFQNYRRATSDLLSSRLPKHGT